ncbi:hypothetical protein HID58_038428, partial [Brassica napus]
GKFPASTSPVYVSGKRWLFQHRYRRFCPRICVFLISALDRVCMALYGPQGSVEEMSRFVVGLVACSLEMRSRLSDDVLLRR